MPVYRKDLKATSIFKKLSAYHATQRRELHHKLFGVGNFRVLTVTTIPDRVANMVAARGKLRGNAGSFLFCNIDALKTSDPLGSCWIDGKGDPTSLT